MVGGAPAPFDQEEGRVVAGAAAPFLLQGVGECAHHRPHPLRRVFDVVDRVDELFLAELFFAGFVLLDQAVGEAQHPVAALERCSLMPGLFTAEADRQGGRAFQLPDDPVVADQQRCGVARVDPLQLAGGDVQAHHLRGDEVVGPELLGDGLGP